MPFETNREWINTSESSYTYFNNLKISLLSIVREKSIYVIHEQTDFLKSIKLGF